MLSRSCGRLLSMVVSTAQVTSPGSPWRESSLLALATHRLIQEGNLCLTGLLNAFHFLPSLPPSPTYLPFFSFTHPSSTHLLAHLPSFSPFSILCLSFPPFIPLPLRHVSFSSSFLPFPYFRLSPFHLNFFFHPFFFLSLFYFMFVISTLYSCAPPSSFHLLLLLCFQNLFLFLHSNSPPTLSSLCLL